MPKSPSVVNTVWSIRISYVSPLWRSGPGIHGPAEPVDDEDHAQHRQGGAERPPGGLEHEQDEDGPHDQVERGSGGGPWGTAW